MEKFSFGTFILGVALTILSALFVGYHRQIADNLGGGVSDYQRYKKWGVVVLGISILVMLNIHRIIFGIFIDTFFRIGR